MKKKLRNGTVLDAPGGQDRFLAALYGSVFGRMLLKPLTAPVVSKVTGVFLSTRLSCVLIRPFIRKNNIDMAQFEPEKYKSYNEFFSRKIRPSARPIDMAEGHLIAPCDSKLTVLPITTDGRFTIKHTEYTAASLLKNAELASEYEGGMLLIFRLTVDDYHRYCYVADGTVGRPVKIPGVLHTVNPVSNDYYPIYKENAREYCVLTSDAFGDIVVMEVGALLVGKIVNAPVSAPVRRGQEKGFFRFGGSTVVLLCKRGVVRIDEDIVKNSEDGFETVVKYGEKIGVAAKL